MTSFADRFLALAGARSPLCLGIDPSVDLLDLWGLPRSVDGLERFCAGVVEAMGDQVAIVKPQSAFFEQFGPEGMAVLARVVRQVQDRGALALIDCKRGDIGSTLTGYAQAMLGHDSPFGGDAMTVTAYLGFGALKPLLDFAVQKNAGVFVVVRSSNPEGKALQTARLADGRTVATGVADEIGAYNAPHGPVGPVGAVMGATIDDPDTGTLSHLSNALILAPGIGAQGATFDDLNRNFRPAIDRVLPAVSRGILSAGPSPSRLRDAIARHCDDARRMRSGH
jgi:orotidine-5'-phosphate decarboxylase